MDSHRQNLKSLLFKNCFVISYQKNFYFLKKKKKKIQSSTYLNVNKKNCDMKILHFHLTFFILSKVTFLENKEKKL